MRHVVWFAFLGLVITSCYSDNKEELYQNFPPSGCDTSMVTYSEVIRPLSFDNCAISGCHVGNAPQSGLDLSRYEDLMTIAKDGRLMDRLTGNGPIMPPGGPLPNCEISQIEIWVLDGAPKN